MDIKLRLVGVFCLFMATGGYAKQSPPGLVNMQRQGVMRELLTCQAERTAMMQLLNIIREIEQDLLFDNADNVQSALQSIFEGASSLGDAISHVESSESSSEETTESATTTATDSATPSTPSTTESITSVTTEPTTADSSTGSTSSAISGPNKRMIQLKKDLLRALLLKKLKGH